jgi:potassium-transporting ATPase KdpC subunit
MQIFRSLRPAVAVLFSLTLLTGAAYPLIVTGVAQLLFPVKAAGNLIVKDGKAMGSRLIGQNFTDPGYFWSRPSATALHPYNALASGGSNQGPLSPALIDAVKARIAALKVADPDNVAPVPVDLVTTSASGLDPHISAAAALYQVGRVARARGLAASRVRELASAYAEVRWLGFLGEPRVNVLLLNLALDEQVGLSLRGPTHAVD